MACRVCTHPEAQAIDASLTNGSVPVLQLSRTYPELSRDILNFHRRVHLLKRSQGNGTHKNEMERARRKFLLSFADCGNFAHACRESGVARTTVYQWQEHDADFALAFKQADLQATESLEREAWRRARDGVSEPVFQHGKMVGTIQRYSDNLLMFLLKARAPERYRDRVDVSVTPVIKAVAGFDPASVV